MADEGEFPKANGDIYYGDDANSALVVTVVAGENTVAGNVGYVKQDDGKGYVADTGTADDYRANGIFLESKTAGQSVAMMVRGVYLTTGLTLGEMYYLGAAGAVSTTYSSVRVGVAISTTELEVNIVQDDRDVVGAVKPWLGDLTGAGALTAFWVEANGQTLSDSESPLNGQVIPDLNGSSGDQRFLRGDTASGNTGGSDTHNHKWMGPEVSSGMSINSQVGASGNEAGAGWDADGNPEDWTASGTELNATEGEYTEKISTLPTYYSVRFIVKIK